MSFPKILGVSTLLFSQSLFAGILTLAGGPNSIKNVNIAVAAKGAIEGRDISLTHVSAGLRKKFVIVTDVDVYVAQILVSDKSKFACSAANALTSVATMPQTAIVANFVFNVTQSQLLTAFKDSLAANNVSVTDPSIAALLKAVQAGGGASRGQVFTIVGENLNDGTDSVTYESPTGAVTTIKGPSGFIKSVFSIWLGNHPADDSDLGDLINQLTTCGN